MIELRDLTTQAELAEAVRVQKAVWGFEDIELLPVRLFGVAAKIGGQVMGAFDGERMVAFLLAVPGIKPGGGYYLHSHMLGVLPEYRDQGIGRGLKLRQREDAVRRGIDLVEWTFDPLEIRNAYFNIERLGAIVRRYVLNKYGITTSALHGGLPTDRCVAEWWVWSERVRALESGGPPARAAAAARISVPASIARLRTEDPAQAREIQAAVSSQFVEHFQNGLAVTGFERSPQAGTYLLTPWDSK